MGRKVQSAMELDPRGVVRESYRIEGITEAQCRSIFLDWAIGLPPGVDARSLLPELIELYAGDAPDHPMTGVLKAGLGAAPAPGRRGGRRARHAD